jgi:hypothetical protein
VRELLAEDRLQFSIARDAEPRPSVVRLTVLDNGGCPSWSPPWFRPSGT